ncbi:thioredoxin domain-containing protein [Polycladidibacter hongkongensis]|uniref:thioredoxin domain-containing protein n=1 Tax=Polycladidibacter hongkongensis TaxID=1647556 RepID=UPI0012E357A4|nr:thioredoxin domain-containing protein [Pseudovibrio hongkongensis]
MALAYLLSGARAEEYTKEQLLPETELQILSEGTSKAPVYMVEYSSLTCSHCGHFAKKIKPLIKEEFIDTGKLYYVTREFPLDAVASAAYMIGRALPHEAYAEYLEVMFVHQRDWAYTKDPYAALVKMGRQFGLSQKQVDAAISNQQVLDMLLETHNHATKVLGVTATPTFFINGKKYVGALPYDQLQEILNEQIAKGY